MLPTNNLVSFVKKLMVKNPSDNGPGPGDQAANKLARLKQTLTSGLQQATESVTKFSPKKHMNVPSALDLSRRLQANSSRDNNGDNLWLPLSPSSSLVAKEGENLAAALHSPSMGQLSGLRSTPGTTGGPPDRATSCRVCVRSLSGNEVTYHWCSQCNLKVCEDCASYSNIDAKDSIAQAFWRCSVCRRRSQDIPRSAVGRVQPSQSHTALSKTTSAASVLTRDSPLRQRRSEPRDATTAVGGIIDVSHLLNHSAINPALDIKKNYVHSYDDLRNLATSSSQSRQHRHRQSMRGSTSSIKPRKLSSTSASESSLEENEYPPPPGAHPHPGSGYSTHSRQEATGSRRSIGHRESSPSLYLLSAEDAASQSRGWNQRRYSSESSDCSEATTPSGHLSRSRQNSREDNSMPTGSSSLQPMSSNRRRLSYRNKRDYHIYDMEVNDGYDADEQSVGAFDSSPSPGSCNDSVNAADCHLSSLPRRSFDAHGGQLPDMSAVSRSPRGSIYEPPEEQLSRRNSRKISMQLSDPQLVNSPGSLSRSQSPRPSLTRAGRSSGEGEAIRIIIDDVDCGAAPERKKKSSTGTPAVPMNLNGNSGTSIHVARLRRDPAKAGLGFIGGFGLTLAAGGSGSGPGGGHVKSDRHGSYFHPVISSIEANSSAQRAGLRCGDRVLCWDGVKLIGRSYDEIRQELEHSGDSIEIEVERCDGTEGSTSSSAPDDHELKEPPLPSTSRRPSIKISNGSPLVTGAGAGSAASSGAGFIDSSASGSGRPGSPADEPSPTRRRQLPQAPVVSIQATNEDQLHATGLSPLVTSSGVHPPSTSPVAYRLQMKIKCTVERHHCCLVMAVIGAEKSASSASVTPTPSLLHSSEEISHANMADRDEDSMAWVQVILTLQNGFRRRFASDRTEMNPPYSLRWNSVFNCSDLTLDEAQRAQLSVSLWEDSFRRGDVKLAETFFELDGVTLDGRSLWLPLKRCDSAFSSPSLSPMTPRRLSKAFSQEQSNDLSEPNSLSESNSTSTYGIPRSRSAEANVLLHPDAVPWSGGSSGLSAPASLAPSRRGSSVHPQPEPDHLSPNTSMPSSRRGSSVSANDVAAINVAAVTQMVQQKLALSSSSSSPSPSMQRRSQSFRLSPSASPSSTPSACHSPVKRTASHKGVHNATPLELGPGQILPSGFKGQESRPEANVGQIKMGVILSKGHLEVEIISARNLPLTEGSHQPDTYTEVSLKQPGRSTVRKKTRIMRQTCHPQFHQTLIFDAGSNPGGSTLVVSVQLKRGNDVTASPKSPQRSSAVDHRQGGSSATGAAANQSAIGYVHLSVEKLPLTFLTMSWYRLVPPYFIDSFQDGSP